MDTDVLPQDRPRARDDTGRSTLIPTFAQPEQVPDVAPLPAPAETIPAPPMLPPPRRGLRGLLSPRPDGPDGTPTENSSRGSGKRDPVDEADAVLLLTGILGMLAAAAVWIVQSRSRGMLSFRQPSKQQSADIARPLAAIAARHVPAHLLNADLADVIHAGNATAAYATAGPLIVPAVPPAQPQGD